MKRANLFVKMLPELRNAGNSAKSVAVVDAGGTNFFTCQARILGRGHGFGTETIVVYGPTGETGSVQFDNDKPLKVTFPANSPQEQVISTPDSGAIRVVSINTALADRTWDRHYPA